MTRPALVRDELPAVYADLEQIVAADGKPRLTASLPALVITEPCGCGDTFCASFYTGQRPAKSWAAEGSHRTLAEADTELVFSVDVVNDAIRFVEIFGAEETEAGRSVAMRLTELMRSGH